MCEVAGLVDCQCPGTLDACKFCCSDDINAKDGLTSAASCKPAVEYEWFSKNDFSVALWLEPGSSATSLRLLVYDTF